MSLRDEMRMMRVAAMAEAHAAESARTNALTGGVVAAP